MTVRNLDSQESYSNLVSYTYIYTFPWINLPGCGLSIEINSTFLFSPLPSMTMHLLGRLDYVCMVFETLYLSVTKSSCAKFTYNI